MPVHIIDDSVVTVARMEVDLETRERNHVLLLQHIEALGQDMKVDAGPRLRPLALLGRARCLTVEHATQESNCLSAVFGKVGAATWAPAILDEMAVLPPEKILEDVAEVFVLLVADFA